MHTSPEYYSEEGELDELPYEEFEGQYTAILALIDEALEDDNENLLEIYNEKKIALEKENPVNLFRIQNANFFQEIGTPPLRVIQGIARATKKREEGYLSTLLLDLTGRLYAELPEEWAFWDATYGMTFQEIKAFREYKCSKILEKVKGTE